MCYNQQSNIQELASEACQHERESIQRQRAMDRLIRAIQNSGSLWVENTPYYEDALQITWKYFCVNLCEAVTAERPYDPTIARVTTWLNEYLRWRLRDFREAEHQQRQYTELQKLMHKEMR